MGNHTYSILSRTSSFEARSGYFPSGKKSREIALPASHCNDLPCLLEHAHDLVNDAEQGQVIIIIYFKRTKGIGMRVKGSKVTS